MRGHKSRLGLTHCSRLRMLEIVAATRKGPILVSWVTRVASVIFAIRLGKCPTLSKSIQWSWFKMPWSRHMECIKVFQSRNSFTVNFEEEKKYYAKVDHYSINLQTQLGILVATLVNFLKLRDDPRMTLR